MSLALDLALIAIVAYCGWRGFRTGIINGVAWILAIIIAVYGANLIATAYSGEFTGMLEPFAIGVVDNALGRDEDTGEDGEGIFSSTLTVQELQALDVYDVSMLILQNLGLSAGAAEGIARETAQLNHMAGAQMTTDLTALLCDRITFVALFAIAFMLIFIVFSVIGNVFDLSFGLPGHENLNHITGAALGVIRGLLIITVLSIFVRYTGLFLSPDTVSATRILSRLVENNQLAALIGI